MKRCEYCRETFDTDEGLLMHLIQRHGDRMRLRKFEHPEKRNPQQTR
jgi:hypothetical protein